MRNERLLKTTKRIVATIELTLYSVKDLADMAEYLYERKMSDEDKAAVLPQAVLRGNVIIALKFVPKTVLFVINYLFHNHASL